MNISYFDMFLLILNSLNFILEKRETYLDEKTKGLTFQTLRKSSIDHWLPEVTFQHTPPGVILRWTSPVQTWLRICDYVCHARNEEALYYNASGKK